MHSGLTALIIREYIAPKLLISKDNKFLIYDFNRSIPMDKNSTSSLAVDCGTIEIPTDENLKAIFTSDQTALSKNPTNENLKFAVIKDLVKITQYYGSDNLPPLSTTDPTITTTYNQLKQGSTKTGVSQAIYRFLGYSDGSMSGTPNDGGLIGVAAVHALQPTAITSLINAASSVVRGISITNTSALSILIRNQIG